jgi:hypothetical protein
MVSGVTDAVARPVTCGRELTTAIVLGSTVAPLAVCGEAWGRATTPAMDTGVTVAPKLGFA